LRGCWAVDLIYGPEPPTAADKQPEAEHRRLRTAFPFIDLDGTIAVDEERHGQTHSMPNNLLTAFGAAPLRPAASVHRRGP
jgi:hypothetical protein